MQRRMFVIVLVLILLCSCGSKGEDLSDNGDAISLQVPDTTEESEKNIPQVTITEYPMPEEIAALEKLDLMDMGLYADTEQSMRNSNQLNFGYLTTDEEGNVYFMDETQQAIFMCGSEGENKELLYEGIGGNLHVSNGYLYFVLYSVEGDFGALCSDSIVRIDVNTKEAEVLYENPPGQILIMQDILYSSDYGLISIKLEEPDGEFTRLSEIECAFFNTDGRFLLYNESSLAYERGYLLAWDIETGTNYFVESKIAYPLLTGNWFSYMDFGTGTRHVLDLETGTDTDLGYYIQHAVGDGNKLYWAKQATGSFQIMVWYGEEVQEFLTVEGKEGVYGDVLLYLTEDYLYWMFESKIFVEADWGYYRLSDGKMGRLN